jgi:hypothetical protein
MAHDTARVGSVAGLCWRIAGDYTDTGKGCRGRTADEADCIPATLVAVLGTEGDNMEAGIHPEDNDGDGGGDSEGDDVHQECEVLAKHHVTRGDLYGLVLQHSLQACHLRQRKKQGCESVAVPGVK